MRRRGCGCTAEELPDTPRASTWAALKGNRIALVSPTGGLLVLASDRCAHHGFEFPRLHAELEEEIRKKLRSGVVNIGNPVDLGDVHQAEARLFIVDRLLAQDYIDGVVLILISRMSASPEAVNTGGFDRVARNLIPDLAELSRVHAKPLVSGSGQTTWPPPRDARRLHLRRRRGGGDAPPPAGALARL